MKRLLKNKVMWLLSLMVFVIYANDDVLPVDEAFPRMVVAEGDEIHLTFNIAEGYYLYHHAFNFEGVNLILSEAEIPQGKKKTDEFFGEVETYRGAVTIKIPYQLAQPEPQLIVKFQGCADIGICYPPQKREIELNGLVKINDQLEDNALVSEPLFGSSGSGGGSFFSESGVLPVSEAFVFETIALSEDTLSARFTMAPNVYLYKDQVEFSTLTSGVNLGLAVFPEAVKKDDPEFGLVDVYYDVVEIEIPYTRSQPVVNADIEAMFQGCQDGKVCYPPESRLVSMDLPKATKLTEPSQRNQNVSKQFEPLSETQQLTQDIGDKSWFLIVIQFLGLGLLLSVTPCVYPMVPILSSLIVGQKDPSARKAFVLSLTYVLAMAFTYTLVGVVAGLMGANLQAMFQKPAIIIGFSVVFVLLALSMFGFYDLQLPQKWQTKLSAISSRQKGGSILGVGVMGLLSALIVGPCVAPPLAAAVIYISTHDTGAVMGGLALFAMSFGMGIPLVVIGTSAGTWMPTSGGWMNVVKSFFGIALLGMAVWFLSRIIDGNVILFMWALLLIISAVMWYQYAKDNGLNGAPLSLVKGIHIMALLIGLIQLLGAMAGGSDPIRPLKGIGLGGVESQPDGLVFVKVKSLADLQRAIDNSDKPVYFDFYADWCTECKRMEATTFKDSEVVALSKQFTLLKADVTQHDDVDAALMQYFQVAGPPASLFFGKDGRALTQFNFFGFKSAVELKQTFEKILKSERI